MDAKKIWDLNPVRRRVVHIGPSGRIFFRPSSLTFGSLALQSLELQVCIVSHLKVLILEQLDLA